MTRTTIQKCYTVGKYSSKAHMLTALCPFSIMLLGSGELVTEISHSQKSLGHWEHAHNRDLESSFPILPLIHKVIITSHPKLPLMSRTPFKNKKGTNAATRVLPLENDHFPISHHLDRISTYALSKVGVGTNIQTITEQSKISIQ